LLSKWPLRWRQYRPDGNGLYDFCRRQQGDAKYLSSGHCNFWEEDFQRFHFRVNFKLLWNHLYNCCRKQPKYYSFEVWSKSIEWFRRRFCLKKLWTLTEDARRINWSHKYSVHKMILKYLKYSFFPRIYRLVSAHNLSRRYWTSVL
jgi:hypothetical protein